MNTLEQTTSESPVLVDEAALVLFLLNRNNYDKYYPYIKKLNLDKETDNFLKVLESYYKEHDKQQVPVEEFITFFAVKRPGLRRRQAYSSFLERLDNIKISPRILEENLNNILETYYVGEIINRLTDVLDGNEYGVLDTDIKDILREFEENKVRLSSSNDMDIFVTETLGQLLEREQFQQGKGFMWRLSCLNEDIGPLCGESLGHVFARVDAGKTSFIVSEVSHFAGQLEEGEFILWIGNEETLRRVKRRVYQSILRCTREELAQYSSEAEAEFVNQGGHRILFYDNSSTTIDDIREFCKKFNIRLVVVDNGDKLKYIPATKGLSPVELLTSRYQAYRELAKELFIPIITVGQAGATPAGTRPKKWLSEEDMYMSKTGKPGELDWAIGIGKYQPDIDLGIEDVRYLSLCKNKMKDGIHGRHAVHFDAQRAIYSDVQ